MRACCCCISRVSLPWLPWTCFVDHKDPPSSGSAGITGVRLTGKPFLFCFVSVFRDGVSLCSLGCPGLGGTVSGAVWKALGVWPCWKTCLQGVDVDLSKAQSSPISPSPSLLLNQM